MRSSISQRLYPCSPSILLNPFVVQVPSHLQGAYGFLGALLSFLYWSIHWTMGTSVFYGVLMVGLNRDRRRNTDRDKALAINEVAASAWEKIEDGLESAAVDELHALHQLTPGNPMVRFYLSRGLLGVDAAQGRALMVAHIKTMGAQEQPCDLRAYFTLGQHCAHLGNNAEADWAWRQGQNLSKDEETRASFVMSRVLLQAESNPRQALEILEAAPIDSVTAPRLHCASRYWRGYCLEALGQVEWALKEFEYVAALQPDFEDVAERLALLQQRCEQFMPYSP